MTDIAGDITSTAVFESVSFGQFFAGTYSGQLEAPGDHDWIAVTLVAGKTYSIFGSVNQLGADPGNASMSLRDASGNLISSSTDEGAGLNAYIQVAVVTTGTYFIDISESGVDRGTYSVLVGSLLTHLGAYDDVSPTGSDEFLSVDSGERLAAGAGDDTVTLQFDASDALGEQGDDSISGNDFGNMLSGGLGNDSLAGLGGWDRLFGDAGDDYLSGGDNEDTLFGGDGMDDLYGGSEDDELRGGADADYLSGGTGIDTLYAGTGADVLMGGDDDDYYVIDSADIVIEASGAAAGTSDLVYFGGVAGETYVLPDNVEYLFLFGSAAINGTGNTGDNGIDGNSAANVINGGGGSDAIAGLAGNDTLDGGAGADILEGGDGNDTYLIGPDLDTVTETAGATAGTADHVKFTGIANQTYTLGGTVELLTLLGTAASRGTGNGLANILVGNAASNILMGLGGTDSLNGGGGTDDLRGGDGNDTYLIDATIDGVTEAAGAAAGTADQVRFTGTTGQTYTLAGNVETLVLLGAAAENGTGNVLANTITGNNAANVITGAGGGDTLTGGGGNDRFVYQGASDSTPVLRDRIVDFDDIGNDRIDLSAVFSGTLTWRGTDAFNDDHQVRIRDIAGSSVLVEVNLGGTLVPDLVIRLIDTTLASMTKSDFIL